MPPGTLQGDGCFMLRCECGSGEVRSLGHFWGAATSVMAHTKQMPNPIFAFHLFLERKEILFGFLLVSENRYECRSFVKTKWRNANLSTYIDEIVHCSPLCGPNGEALK